MQKKILFLIFGLLSLFVAVLLFVLVKSSNVDDTYGQNEDSIKESRNSINKDTHLSWAKKLSMYQKRDFLMPVNELYITIKFPKPKIKKELKKEKYYKLSIPDLNDYSLFCILQIFNKKMSPFVIENSYDKSLLFVKAKSKDELNDVANSLKKYNIEYKIEKPFYKK